MQHLIATLAPGEPRPRYYELSKQVWLAVRADRCRTLREVPRAEWGIYLEVLLADLLPRSRLSDDARNLPLRHARWLPEPALMLDAVEEADEVISSPSEPGPTEVTLILAGDIDGLTETALAQLLEDLQRASLDPDLALIRLEAGSIVLALRTTAAGAERLRGLAQSGALSHLLGHPVVALHDGEARGRPKGTKDAPRARVLFYAYARCDQRHRLRLEIALAMLKRDGLLAGWHHELVAHADALWMRGEGVCPSADLYLFLISPELLADARCIELMTAAMRLQRDTLCDVVPILLRPSEWQRSPIGALQVLPGNEQAITTWRDRDSAWLEVAQAIRACLESARATRPILGTYAGSAAEEAAAK